MTEYAVITFALKTGIVTRDVPPLDIVSLQLTHVLNAAGACSLVLPLQSPTATPDRLAPGTMGICVVRNGLPVWIGFIRAARADLAADTLTVECAGIHAHYARVYLSGYTRQTDQTTMMKDWYTSANNSFGIGTVLTSLVPMGAAYRSWTSAEFISIADAVDGLAEDANGLVVRYEPYWEDATQTRVKHRVVAAARATAGTYGTILEHGVNCEVPQVTYDGSSMVTDAYAVGGQAEGSSAPLWRQAQNLGLLQSMPARGVVVAYPDVLDYGTLMDKARAALTVGRAPVVIPTVTLYDGAASPADFPPGIAVTVRAKRGFVALDAQYVVTECSTTIDGNGRETLSLSLASRDLFVNPI